MRGSVLSMDAFQDTSSRSLKATVLMLLIALPMAILPGVIAADAVADETKHVTVRGVDRQYIVHLPTGLDQDAPTPLLFMFHGFGGSASDAASNTYDWQSLADSENFIIVFPDSLVLPEQSIGNYVYVDAGKRWDIPHVLASDRTDSQDLDFLTAVIDLMDQSYRVDRCAVHTTGHSFGASFSYYAAMVLRPQIAAFGFHSGAFVEFGAYTWPIPVPQAPPDVPGMLIHSTDDPSDAKYEHSQSLVSQLQLKGHGGSTLTTLTNMGHSWDKGKNPAQWTFFENHRNCQQEGSPDSTPSATDLPPNAAERTVPPTVTKRKVKSRHGRTKTSRLRRHRLA